MMNQGRSTTDSASKTSFLDERFSTAGWRCLARNLEIDSRPDIERFWPLVEETLWNPKNGPVRIRVRKTINLYRAMIALLLHFDQPISQVVESFQEFVPLLMRLGEFRSCSEVSLHEIRDDDLSQTQALCKLLCRSSQVN